MIDLKKYKSLYEIPLPQAPNSAYTATIEDFSFRFEFRTIGEKLLLYSWVDNILIVSGREVRGDIVLNKNTKYAFPDGELFFIKPDTNKITYKTLDDVRFIYATL